MSVVFVENQRNLRNTFSNFDKSHLIVLCDSNSKKYCLDHFYDSIGINDLPIIQIPSGEENKNIETCKHIWTSLLKLNCDKSTILINLGGGVVTDAGGLAASIFKRGINFIQVPTTLLAMVDAAIGGKNGVDFLDIKNALGTIAEPLLTIIDYKYLETLDNRLLRSGFAEMLKHGLILDQNHWRRLINADYRHLDYNLIARSLEIKRQIVEKDPCEKSIRKLLNFGHTLGHGIEAYGLRHKLDILHGEAIAAGLIMESYISFKMSLISESTFLEIESQINFFYKPISINKKAFLEIMSFIKQDKKNENGAIRFVLLKEIGKGIYNIDVNEDFIIESLEFYCKN
jgi:3-dehydroquinate synthase